MSGLNYTVRGLPTDKEFQFRIVPLNAAGAGEPSEPTDTVKVRDPPGKKSAKKNRIALNLEQAQTHFILHS